MSGLTSMWVHGLMAEAEYPVQKTVVKGWGKEFVGHRNSNWFHVPITTPAILEDVRPKLANVSVFFKTDGTVIRAIHVYDGSTKAGEIPIETPVEGDHSASIDESNTWPIEPPLEIKYGLGISIFVTNKYYKESDAQGADDTNPYMESAANKASFTKEATSVLFTAAGADFEVPGTLQPEPDTLLPNLILSRGMSKESKNGLYKLEFNTEGNLIFYNTADPDNHLFETNTYAPAGIVADAKCTMQGDGNLVISRTGNNNMWDSKTAGHPGAFLRVEDDGKVSIIDPVNRIWHMP